nr:adenylate kinase 7 [Hymenolepis microstoma]
MCPTTHYVLAVDEGNNTQLEIVKAISKILTTGKVKHISTEEAKTNSGFTQKEIDNLTLDLRLEAQFARENMSFEWIHADGLVNSINKLVSEFQRARGLIPIKICILGPPLSGKTKLSLLLSDYYSVPHIHVKKVIEDRIKELEEKIKNSVEEDGETETDSGSETEDPAEALEEIQAALFTGKGRLDNSMLCDLIKRRLNTKECQNHGYILDGFPKTKAQADLLFGKGEDEEGGEDEDEENVEKPSAEESEIEREIDSNTKVAQLESERNVRENIIPNVTEETTFFNKVDLSPKPNALPSCIIFLQASDIFLFSRALQLPCDEVQPNHNDEEGFMRRLAVYRRAHAGSEVAALMADEELRKALESENLLKIINGEAGSLNPSEQLAPLMAGSISPNTLLAYFEDRGVSTFNFDVAMDTSGKFDEIERKIEVAIGPPRNYGPITKRTKIKEELQMKIEEERHELEQSRTAEELKRRDAQKQEMFSLLESIQAEEDEALQKASKPLREYLSKFVLPTLTKGVFECIWRRPEDPVDYLAEYLFRNNPQVD